MPRIVSYSRRPQSGQITCYLNRTYHVLATSKEFRVEKSPATEYGGSLSRPRLSGPLGSPSALRHLTHYHKPSLPLKGMSQNESPGKSLDSAGAPGRFAGT